jgi:subtilisin family serine protease
MRQFHVCISFVLCIFATLLLPAQSQPFYPENSVLIRWKSTSLDQSRIRADLGGEVKATRRNADVEIWTAKRALNPQEHEAWLREIQIHPAIEIAEPNYSYQSVALPNDAQLSQQWGWSDIGMEQVWDQVPTGSDVLIGLIDTGIDYGHEDLQPSIFQNLAEDADGDGSTLEFKNGQWQLDAGDLDGIDADGNGYVDDLAGWDFVNGDNDPFDDNGHGTHVAGIMTAQTNNSLGISGINPHAKVLALKAFDAQGSGSLASILPALAYARNMGVQLTNNSWGGADYSNLLFAEIDAAREAGQLFVAAAGNTSTNIDAIPTYPAAYSHLNVVSVTSHGQQSNLSPFANYGSIAVDLSAPGADIYSTLPGNQYGSKSGTSMATPFVTGALSLLIDANPGVDPLVLKETLLQNVSHTNGGTMTFSAGSLDLPLALNANLDNAPVLKAQFQIDGQACINAPVNLKNLSVGADEYKWFVNGSRISRAFETTHTFNFPGTYEVKLVILRGEERAQSIQQIYIAPPPQVDMDKVAGYYYCAENVVLRAEQEGMNYKWLLNSQFLSAEREITASQSGRYRLRVQDGCGNASIAERWIQFDKGCVWPGDANADGRVNSLDFLTINRAEQLYLSASQDPKYANHWAFGKPRKDAGTNWQSYVVHDWTLEFPADFGLAPSLDIKHGDCDGNGEINAAMDGSVIVQNANYPPSVNLSESNQGIGVRLQPVNSIFQGTDEVLIEFDVILENVENTVGGIHGLSLSFDFNLPLTGLPTFSLTAPGFQNGQSLAILRNTPLANSSSVLGMNYSMETGLTGSTKTSGKMAKLGVIVSVDDITDDPASLDFASFSMIPSQILAIDSSGNFHPVQGVGSMQVSTVILEFGANSSTNSSISLNEGPLAPVGFKLFPNPAKDIVSLDYQSGAEGSSNVRILTTLGQEVQRHELQTQIGANHWELAIGDLAPGNYFIQYRDARRSHAQMLSVRR